MLGKCEDSNNLWVQIGTHGIYDGENGFLYDCERYNLS